MKPLNWVMAMLYEHLFDYERIEGERRRKFDELSGDVDVYEVWIGDGYGSRATFGNVVISDDHYNEFTNSELESVFLHEVGHVADKSTVKLIIYFVIAAAVPMFLTIKLFGSFLILALVRLVGDQPVVVLALLFIISAINALLGLHLVLLWRYPKFEYTADEYPVKKGYGNEFISAISNRPEPEHSWKSKLIGMIRSWYYPSHESRVDKIKENMNST
jgi:hypothetical protein